MKLIIFINSAGPNVSYENLFDTISSISSKCGIEDYGFYFVAENETIANMINEIFLVCNIQNKLLELKISNDSWAKNFNLFFNLYKEKTEYIIYSHDDLYIKTDNFFIKALKEIDGIDEELGWITFTSDAYYRNYGLGITNSVREGFSLDRGGYPGIFECHSMKNGDNLDALDMPPSTVKCHAPFPHFVMISSKTLEKVGPCSDWSNYTLLIDEDWGLEALKKNLVNIWIPDIVYTHPLRKDSRKEMGVRYQNEVHAKFKEKWGWNFDIGGYSDSFVEEICEKFKDTNIPLTKGKNSFDWQYPRRK